MEIFEKVCAIIKKNLGLDDDFAIDSSTSLEELNADSMDLVEIVMDIESDFGITIPEGAEDKIFTVGDVVKAIEKTTDGK